MKQGQKIELFKKICAGVSAIAMVVTSFAVLPTVATTVVAEESNITEIMPTVDFNNWTDETVAANTQYAGNSRPSGEIFYAMNNPGEIAIKSRGKDDKYLVSGVNELAYRAEDNSAYLGKAAPLKSGEQMVFSFEAYSGADNTARAEIRMANDAGPTRLFALKDGEIHIYNGVADNGRESIYGTVIGRYPLPQNQWVKVDLVYTRLGTTYGGEACDSLKVYINGKVIKAISTTALIITGVDIPMTDSVLDSTVQRFILGPGIIDNVGAKHYTNGEQFVFERDTMAETVVPLITFDDYRTVEIPVVAKAANESAESVNITQWSLGQPIFNIQNDSKLAGKIYANIETKEGSDTDRYYNAAYNMPTGESTKNNGVALNYYSSMNSSMANARLYEGQRLEYALSVHSGKNFTMYSRTSGDSDTAGILNYLFAVSGGKLYVFDGTKTSPSISGAMGYVTLPENSWVDIRVVYTAGDGVDNNSSAGGTDDTVAVYIGPELQKLTKQSGSGYVSDDGINKLVADYHNTTVSRYTFASTAVFDNFSVTKYRDISSDGSSEKKGVLGIDHQPNDFTFFHSERVMLGSKDYEFAKLSATSGNSYFIEPSDKKNQYKGDRLIMSRESGSEMVSSYVMLDIPTYNVVTDYISQDRIYKYFLIEGLFHITSNDLGGPLVTLCYDGWMNNEEQSPVNLLDGRLIAGSSSRQLSVTDDNGDDKWHHLKMIVNVEKGCYDVLLDGELMCRDEEIYGDIQKLTTVRTTLNQGTGSLWIREMEVTGLSKEPTLEKKGIASDSYDFNITKTSQFIDDNLTREYLSDKVVFHGEGDMTYNRGTKTEYDEGSFVYDNEARDVYVPLDILNLALGTSIGYSDGWSSVTTDAEPRYDRGVILAPVKAIAQALGYTSEYYKYGKMVIVSDGDELPESNDVDATPWIDGNYFATGWNSFYQTEFTDAQEISNFIFYDRPTAEQLKDTYYSKEQSHPRVVLTPERVDTIKERIAEDKESGAYAGVYAEQIDKIEASAKSYIDKMYTVEYVFNEDDNVRTLSAASSFSSAMIALGLTYQLTNDEELKADCAELGVRNMKIVSTFPDFNYGHVIDAGVWLYGCAIGFDWLYDAIETEEEREEIAEGILDIGLRPMNRAFYACLPSALSRASARRGNMGNANHFVKWKSNFIPYTQHGLVTASLAFAEYDEETCFDTLEKSIRNWEYSNLGLYPEGGWLEGKSYLGVVHNNTAIAFASLLNVMGDEYNVLNAKGFEESMVAATQLSSMSGAFSYSDDGAQLAGVLSIPNALSFYADYYGRKDLHKIRQWRYRVGDKSTWTYLDLVYYNHFDDQTEVSDRTKTFKELDTIHYTEGTEIVTVHEDWADGNAMFFALAGGPTRHYHFHTDGGDFNLTMDGNRWSYEMGTGNYNIGTNFTKYAGRAEGHNTLVIKPDEDPYLTQGSSGYAWTAQKEQSVATIMDYGETIDGAYATLDMSTLYEDFGAERVHRGAWIDGYDTLTMRDEIVFPEDEEFDGWWFMHTKADYEFIDENTIKLSLHSHKNLAEHKVQTQITDKDSDGDVDDDDYEIWYNRVKKSLYIQVQVDGADEYEVKMMPAEPLPSSPVVSNDPTNTNGVNKVAIYYKGSGEINITVRMSNALGDVINTTPIAQWTAREVVEDGDGFRYNIAGSYNENYQLVAAHYSEGKLIGASYASATYDSPRDRYMCVVSSVPEDADECVLYLWDKTTLRPIAKPSRIRISDLTVIE